MSTLDRRLILLGKNIKKMRKLKNLSQLNLSVKLGITREHLSKLERGIAYPSVKILFEISDILEIEFKDLTNI